MAFIVIAVEDPGPPSLTFGDVLVIGAVLVIAGFVVYGLSQEAIGRYRAWKADREEFREWRRARDDEQSEEAEDEILQSDIVTPTAVAVPASTPPPINQDALAFAVFWASLANLSHGTTRNTGSPDVPLS